MSNVTPFPRSPENTTAMIKLRALFISDVHLGTQGAQAEALLDLLTRTECETLFLIGDIVDEWKLKRGWYWPASHNKVVQRILRMARSGVDVIYIPGNHDDKFRDFIGGTFGNIQLAQDWIHTTADGRRLLVTHGDQWDIVVTRMKWLAHVGDIAYRAVWLLNRTIGRFRRRLNRPTWSLSAYLKKKVKDAVAVMSNYRKAIVAEARFRKVDGVVCGHIHHAEMTMLDGILYINDGDWVESGTCLFEWPDGRLELVRWQIGSAPEQILPVAA